MQGDANDSAPPSGRGPRLTAIDGLRGVASFAVCWYHLVFANHAFVGAGILAAMLRASAENAWTGVEVFFVISGFVIPLALWRAGYRIQFYGTFLLKRVARLDPPYLVSIALCLLLAYLSASVHKLHGPAFHLDLGAVLLHLGYLNAFFHRGWLNPVYWTLAIEFQYYLGMGLLFGALANRRRVVRYLALGGLGALAFLLPSPSLVFRYLFVFMLGMTTFQYFVGLLSLRAYVPTMAAVGIGCYVTLGPMVAALAVATTLIIASVRTEIRILTFLGSISYSLYLVHVPIGGRIMDLGLPHVHSVPGKCAVLVAALAITIASAYGLYRLVEKPAQHWSSSFRYRRSSPETGAPYGETGGFASATVSE